MMQPAGNMHAGACVFDCWYAFQRGQIQLLPVGQIQLVVVSSSGLVHTCMPPIRVTKWCSWCCWLFALQAVPVYSSSDSEDWLIRGYSKCPAYLTRLAVWLRSDAFKQKEAESAALRQKVHCKLSGGEGAAVVTSSIG